MNRIGEGQDQMWDEEDGFYYDVLRLPDGSATRLKVRSLVGLFPLCASTIFEPDTVTTHPRLMEQRGLEVHVLDRVEKGSKPELVRQLGATYHSGKVTDLGFEPDVIVECTGVGQVITDAVKGVAAGGIICLTGVGSGGQGPGLVADVAATMVLRNNVIVGSVNANKRHWYKAGEALARADVAWLSQLVTRREKPADFSKALDRQPDDIKVVIQFAEA
jgi:threonine dehydrogenase-like Zn-dependent dehydrogenase